MHANERDDKGEAPLMVLAARGGSARDVQLLLDAGADVNDGVPLHLASLQGHVDIVNALVSGGANLNLATKHDGSTAVWMASFHGHANVVEELSRRGADMNQARKHLPPPIYTHLTSTRQGRMAARRCGLQAKRGTPMLWMP